MHRSGTSALSNYLVDLGFSLPSASLPPHPQDNPQGYWESSDVVQLNNRLLQAFSMDWKDIGALPHDWQQSDSATGFAAEIELLLRHALETHSQIVIKDPRLCRTSLRDARLPTKPMKLPVSGYSQAYTGLGYCWLPSASE